MFRFVWPVLQLVIAIPLFLFSLLNLLRRSWSYWLVATPRLIS